MQIGDLVRWTEELRNEGQYFRKGVGIILRFNKEDGDPVIYWRGFDCSTCEYRHQVEVISENR